MGQAFGYRAKQQGANWSSDKTFELRVYGLDKVWPHSGDVFVAGKDVCLEEVRLGDAWVYQPYIGQAPPISDKLSQPSRRLSADVAVCAAENPAPFRPGRIDSRRDVASLGEHRISETDWPLTSRPVMTLAFCRANLRSARPAARACLARAVL